MHYFFCIYLYCNLIFSFIFLSCQLQEPRPRRALPAQALRLALLSSECEPAEAEFLATMVRYVVLKGGVSAGSPGKVNSSPCHGKLQKCRLESLHVQDCLWNFLKGVTWCPSSVSYQSIQQSNRDSSRGSCKSVSQNYLSRDGCNSAIPRASKKRL